jgi:alkylation response protein AidB-like acyl-CoA dehydrogenase
MGVQPRAVSAVTSSSLAASIGLSFSDAEERFRGEFRAWLAANVPTEPPPADENGRFEYGRAFQSLLADEGWAGVAWPAEYGGRGADAIEQFIYYDELAWAGAPEIVNRPGLLLAGPTLMVHGDPTLKQGLLPRILRADDIWCQGFSEPAVGSDIASLKTRAGAVESGGWRVNGQKVWTTHAPWADYCFVLCRTEDAVEGRRYDGLSMLLVPMAQEEVVVTPLRQLNGEHEYALVIFNDAHVPADMIIGEPGKGWEVALTLLEFERADQGFSDHSRLLVRLDEVRRFVIAARDAGTLSAETIDDIRPRFLDLWSRCQMLGQMNLGRALALKRGERLDSWGSYVKLYWSELWQAVAEFGFDVVGEGGAGARDFAHDFLSSRGATIYSGTSEIQRNVIGDRILGLPR